MLTYLLTFFLVSRPPLAGGRRRSEGGEQKKGERRRAIGDRIQDETGDRGATGRKYGI
jgi:hypothetical protein